MQGLGPPQRRERDIGREMIGQTRCRGRKPTLHPRYIRITAGVARPGDLPGDLPGDRHGDRPGPIVVTRV
jgi:hypothetical protein